MPNSVTDSATAGAREGWTARRLARAAGPAAAVVFVGGILLAAYVFTPTARFDWLGELEQFGILRHYSLALGCLLGLAFLWPVWRASPGRAQRAGLGLLGLGFVITGAANALASVGIRAGDWAIIGIILLFPVGLLVLGGADVYAGLRRRGGASLLLGVAYLGDLGALFAGYQLASYVGVFVLLSVWMLAMYAELRRASATDG